MADLDRIDSGPFASDDYQGAAGRTRQSTIHYSCMSCGFLFTARVHVAVNAASDPALAERLLQGELNALVCPSCNAAAYPSVPLVYHDPPQRLFLLVVPDALRHQELELRISLLKELAADDAHLPEYVRSAAVVFGVAGLQRALEADQRSRGLTTDSEREETRRRESDDQRRGELDRREEELVAREEDLAAREEDRLNSENKLAQERRELDQRLADLEREREALRALALDLEARERALRQRKAVPPPVPLEKPAAAQPSPPPVPPAEPSSRPQAEVDRWRASEDRVGQLLHDARVHLLARPGAALLPALERIEPTVLVQQRTLEGGSLVCLGVVAAEGDDVAAQAPSASRALFWTMDPECPEDRERLLLLAEEFRLRLELYDDEARPVKSWDLQGPLEENVRWALANCRSESAVGRDFGQARRAFEALGEEQLGRKQHNFSADSFQEMASPASTRLALGIVAYWSQADNERYLIGVKSFPLVYWRAIRERVVRRALEYGLWLSPELVDVALELKLAESHESLLRTLLSSFAEVSLRIKPSDLDSAQDWENWKHLLADCVHAGVEVDKEIEELASASARRAGGDEDERAPGGDLGLLSADALLPLLGQRDLRRDAALELCERGDASALEPVFGAVCAMTRAEVARVMPALISFGPSLLPFLLQGLKHRKSFVRQGCALALGAMKARRAVGPLVEMLLGEPTTIWKEAARALGDMGPNCMGALTEAAKAADVAGRERVAWAMAHAALTPSGRKEIQAIVRGSDGRLARVAAKALGALDEVRQSDQEVRGARPLREQTIVRSFSRQFFDGVALRVDELGEADIVDLEEVLDDGDIVDEEVEVGDEDILER